MPFTTSFHTRFPDYVGGAHRHPGGLDLAGHAPLPRRRGADLRRHPDAVATSWTRAASVRCTIWPLGVDLEQFSPERRAASGQSATCRARSMLNVGRVAVEKNLEAFLEPTVAGTKVVVGDGPALAEVAAEISRRGLSRRQARADLASAYASADVFVFPSRTDTFGLVNIEALASGLPVAAFPVAGPIDIVGREGTGMHGGTKRIGALDEDLEGRSAWR